MALLKNSTVGGGNSGTTSTANYALTSSSFTHQKQPIMPSDQKAKLLAMHRDSRANAGMYVAVVLAVYLVLVIMLLCRYAKRRVPSEPLPSIDSAAEQGRLRLFNFHGRKLACVGRENCNKTFMQFCFGRCRRENGDNKVVALSQQHNIEESNKGTSNNLSATSVLKNDQLTKDMNGMVEVNAIQDRSAVLPTAVLEDEVKQSNQDNQNECVTSEDQQNNGDDVDLSGEED
ncbi:unnamed protein product [Orchesella dallaii]|uniref:Transmembrane protein n=1 Tax=Orchesella dallaii TaxID=48710 RepID=A0ABP1PV82_9HEXA